MHEFGSTGRQQRSGYCEGLSMTLSLDFCLHLRNVGNLQPQVHSHCFGDLQRDFDHILQILFIASITKKTAHMSPHLRHIIRDESRKDDLRGFGRTQNASVRKITSVQVDNGEFLWSLERHFNRGPTELRKVFVSSEQVVCLSPIYITEKFHPSLVQNVPLDSRGSLEGVGNRSNGHPSP